MDIVQVGRKIAEQALANMMAGRPARLSKSTVKGSGLPLKLGPQNYMKVVQAKSKGKGCVLCMTPQEREMNGEGLKEIWEKVKQGASWVKDKIVDTPFYQQSIKPIVRKALEQGISMVPNKTAQDVLTKGLEATSQKWGAWGQLGGAMDVIQTRDPYMIPINTNNMVSSPPQLSSNVMLAGGYMSDRRYRGRASGGSFLLDGRGGSFMMP